MQSVRDGRQKSPEGFEKEKGEFAGMAKPCYLTYGPKTAVSHKSSLFATTGVG
jgi:hypothetical protein